MSLAPIVSSPPGGDHHPHHQQTFSVLSPVESFPDHETQENQAEMATAPRALVVNEDDILSCSSLHSSRVTRIGSNGSIALAPPTAPAGSGSPTAQAAATMAPTRPTCRVVLDALETSPGGAATSVHLGGAAAGGMPRNFDNDSNSKLLSPSILPSKVEEEASGGIETEDQRSLHGSTDRAGEAAVDGMIHPTRPNDQRGGNDDGSSSSSLVLPDPVTLSLSPGGCDIDTDSAELSPGASTKPRNSTTGAGGRPTIIRSPKGDAEPAHRSFVARIGSFPSFFPRKGSKASMWGASGREKSSKKWGMLYSGRSGKSVEDEDEALGLDDHASERARKHWRVLRAVFMSLGIFRVAGLNRLRAKELSAAEVRRGLRRNVTGGGQNIIPTMSFYAPKVTGDAEASTAQYETLCSQWARFSPAIVHRMLRQKLLEHNTTKQEFTCERFSTTLLFADISGFTRLSARLNAEQLKTHTNQYFTMLIDVVARYGGDIIKFCGDAVMIVWPSEHTAPRGVLQANAMQGAACALAMLSECGEYDVGKGEEAVALRLHCGMGSGEMYGYLVGADDRWEYLVAGDPLRQIGEAEPEATQGEVILSPEAWELASTDFVATKTPQNNWLLKGLKEVSTPKQSSPPREVGSEKNRRQRTSGADHLNNLNSQTSDVTPVGGSTGGGGTRQSRARSRGGRSPTYTNQVGHGGEKHLSGSPVRRGKKDNRRDRATTTTEEDELSATVTTTANNDHSYHLIRRGSSSLVGDAPLPSLTVTKNVNSSSAVSEEHRVQASEYLASYIKAQYDGGVETSMKGLSTALRGFTQESARHAIQSNTVKYLAEIRFVTTIFINIYGLEEQLKRGGGYLLQQTMDLGVGSLLKFGGVLRQFVVDDKGCVMIGAFGLPQYSYEDNEVRAISASKEIILAFQGLQLAASIGITTGQVYCGFVGASKRCEYAMMGCSVNLSARLMASAPKNTIQVDFEVWKRSHNFFDFETLTPIKAKGYVNPVPVFRPLGQALKDDHNKRASDAGGPGSDLMVGMAAELEVLENSARRLQTAGVTRPVILLGQSGSGKTRVVRSAQLRHIWRDAANIDTPSHTEKTRENDLEQHDADAGNGAGGGTGGVNGGGGRGGGGGAVMAPVIMTVCRNVHANTPYCIWNSIMDKIFKLETKSSSRGPGETKSRVSFTNNNDRQQQPQQSENGDSYSVDSKEHGGGGTDHDGRLFPARGRPPTGHLPPLSAVPSVPPRATTVAKEWGAAGKSLPPHWHSAHESTVQPKPLAAVDKGGSNLDGQLVKASPKKPAPTRTTWSEEGTAAEPHPKKPVSLLKQKTESSICVGGDPGGEGAGGGGPVRVSMAHKSRARELALSCSRGDSDAATAPKPSMRAAGGGNREGATQRRPQRYDKIKMKVSPASDNNRHCSVTDSGNTATGSCRDGVTGNNQNGVGIRPIAIKLKTAGVAFGALSVARKVASGFRGDPDWASRASRSAGKRSSMRDISSDFDDEDLASSARRQRASYRIEKSRREQASRRSVPRKPSAFMPERTVRDVERSVEKSELRRDSGSQSGNGMAQMQMLTADNLKGIASVEMEMEGMESNADPVKAVGEAADIVMWMRQFCPEMVPMAPLLQELMFTGFSETRITAAFPPDVRHRNLERLVVAVMRSAIDNEGRRLLLVIEDAQWMNQLSMKLLLKLAKAGLRIMIIISARPFEEYFETVPHDFTTFRQIGTTVEMSPLSPSDCLVLAKHMVGEAVMAAHPDADLLPEGSDVILHEKSGGGNPLFVRNIAITLRDNLVTSGTVTPLADLPAGFFHALIVSRFDALEPPEQTVLKAGTVIGATFSKELLLHMLPNNSRYRMENLHGALLKLIEANFISRSVVGKTEHFSFVHNSVQETVYTMMLTDQKESLHEVCAQWHEEHNKGNASYQSVIMHHWMRSSNTPKKVECHLMAAKKAQEVFEHEAAIQHMLALLAIAFGKDMATATVISLEPFLEATQPSLNKQNQAALRPPPPPSQGVAPSANTATAASGTGVGNVDETGAGHAQAAVKDALPGASATPQAAAGPATSTKHAPAYGEKGHGLCAWFVDGMGSSGMSRRRRRLSSMVVPVAETLTGKEAEAAERLDAARTAARLGCSVGNLTKRQREMLVAKDQEWLWAADFLPCLEFSDPMFSPAMVGRWIGWIGMAHLHLGRLLPAHNHMQEALVYLGFPAVPAQALPFDRALCLIKEVFLARGTARDAEDAIFAASLYGSIADISIKAGMGGNLAFINRLVRCSTHSIDFMDYTHEGVRLIVNLAHEELANGHHDKVEAYLDRALALSIDIGDPITRGIALTESGTYNAGEGLVAAAEEDFAEAFEMFAPAGDYSRCGEVVVESAYVKLCSGATQEALSMFNEVRDTASAHKNDFLSQTSLHGAALVHAIALNTAEASACLAQMRTIVEEDWARRRGRRGRTAAAAEGTSHTSLVVMETLDAYLAAARGDGKAALKCVRRASLRLSRPGALRFSSGLFLHLATDACFTILEQDMLPPGAEAHRKVLAAARLLIRTLGKFAQVFDLMSPLHQLGRARWSLLNGMDKVAEKALDLGLVISEEDVSFPFAEGLLLLHSTRIEAFPMEERRARARRGRRILHRIGACLIPPADRHCKQKEAGGRADGGAPSAAPVLE